MNSLFKSLYKRTGGGVFSIVLLTLLLTGCPKPSGSNNEGGDEPKPVKTELDFEVQEVGMTYCTINWNWLEGYSFKKVTYSTTEDFSSDNRTIDFSYKNKEQLPYDINDLTPGTDYYIRLEGRNENWEDFEKKLNFHTSDKGPLDKLNIEYKNEGKYVKFSFKYVPAAAKVKFIKVYRKVQKDAEWTLIKEGSTYDFWESIEDYEYTPNVENFYKIELFDADGKKLGADVTSELSITPEDEDDNLGIKVVKQGYSYLDLIWDYSLYDSYKITYSTGSQAEDSREYAGNDLTADKAVHFYFPKEKFRSNASTNVVFNIECYKSGTLEKTVKRNFEIKKTGDPEDLITKLGDNKISLQWNSFNKSNDAIAKVYRRTDPSADYELIGTEKYWFYLYKDEFAVFDDKTFVAGTINYYKVELYEADGLEAGNVCFGSTEVSCDASSKCSIMFDFGEKYEVSNTHPNQYEFYYFDKGSDISDFDDPYVRIATEYSDLYEIDHSTWFKNGVAFDFNTTLSSNIILKAVYRPKPTSFTKYLSEDTKIYLNWKAKEDWSYKLEYGKTDGTLTTVDCGKNTSKILENLEEGQEYTVNLYTVTSDNITSTATTKTIKTEPEEIEFLFIMYLDGDNNLHNPIYLDMNEVEYGLAALNESNFTDQVKVIALWDGYAGDTENPATSLWGTPSTHIYELGIDSRVPDNSMAFLGLSSNTFDWSYTADWLSEGEVDMSSKETLQNYLEWIKAHFSGTKTILQFSNHGGGPRSLLPNDDRYGRRAMCWDDTTGLDTFLKTKDVSDVLAAVDLKNGNKIDLIIEDVCLGSTIEEAYQYKDYTKYFIASPNTVPGFGLDYDVLISTMKKNATIASIGEGIVKQYKQSFSLSKTDWMKVLAEYNAHYGANTFDEKSISLVYNGACGLSFVNLEALEGDSGVLAKLDKLAEGLCGLQGKTINMDVTFNNSTKHLEGDFLEIMRDYLVMPGNPIYYQGSYTWLYDIGAILDAIDKLFYNNLSLCQWLNSQVPAISTGDWQRIARTVMSPLSSAIACSWRDGYTKPSYDSTVTWSNAWIGNSLYQNYYGLSICGGTIAEDIDAQKYPSFYETDLQFAKDCPHWDALLKLWFPAD